MPYICYINPPGTYEPSVSLIAAISQAEQAAITTLTDHGYDTGTIVRLHVPRSYGMVEVNRLSGTISVTGLNTFTIDIDTRLFTPFALDPVLAADERNDICPQVIPIGEDNSILTMAEHNALPR